MDVGDGHTGRLSWKDLPRNHLGANMDLRNAHVNEGLLACTHSSVTPKFAHDLPSCHIPQHHRLVSTTRAEMAVVKGTGGQEREGQYPLRILASALLIPVWPRTHPAASSTS